MARTQVLKFADRALGGRLPLILAQYREEGMSFRSMAKRLSADHAVEVTGETIRAWCLDLGIHPATDEGPRERAS